MEDWVRVFASGWPCWTGSLAKINRGGKQKETELETKSQKSTSECHYQFTSSIAWHQMIVLLCDAAVKPHYTVTQGWTWFNNGFAVKRESYNQNFKFIIYR